MKNSRMSLFTIPSLLLSIILLPSFLTGCSTFNNQNNNHAPASREVTIIRNDTANNDAETKMAEAATTVSDSLQQLAVIERATHPQVRMPSPQAPEITGMTQMATIEWTGPVGPLVSKIAQATHYKLRVLGRAPPIPIIVAISAKDTLIADILRDATFQCGTKASIVVYPASRVIELRYAKV